MTQMVDSSHDSDSTVFQLREVAGHIENLALLYEFNDQHKH